MLNRKVERAEIPHCAKDGLGLIVYSPLAQGLLSAKYLEVAIPEGTRAAGTARLRQRVTEQAPTLRPLAEVAAGRRLTLSQSALAWILRQPVVASCIVDASRPEHLREDAAGSGVTLSADELAQIDRILGGQAGRIAGRDRSTVSERAMAGGRAAPGPSATVPPARRHRRR